MDEPEKVPKPLYLPLDLDATGDRLNEQLAQCQVERAIVEDKITNPHHSILLPAYTVLCNAADALRAKRDRIWYKIQIHRRAKRHKIELPKRYREIVGRYTTAVRASVKSEGETTQEFEKLRAAVDASREEALAPFRNLEEISSESPDLRKP